MESKKWCERVVNLKRILFEKYVSDWTSLDRNSFTYKLNTETMYQNLDGEAHKEMRVLVEENGRKWLESRPVVINTPKCPTCGSAAIQNISELRKGFTTALFGVFSNDFGKKFECKNCGYKW